MPHQWRNMHSIPSTIQHFGEIPPELRDVVWNFAFPYTKRLSRVNRGEYSGINSAGGGGSKGRDHNSSGASKDRGGARSRRS
ncbi:hypothetical protein MFRU_015g01350 [Monilinia fructicola]|uniref:Uncharacterized protein n=1 Tax=Monilinia fructicola TaxID=38448 RepID=A0A5M9K332_MONFR|nr:hypothetical protein EYC84_005868 [Monilinia fructicola]KAG4029597.1 hypothetical protein MFRU_015g01350 [Monilinia fructicola]